MAALLRDLLWPARLDGDSTAFSAGAIDPHDAGPGLASGLPGGLPARRRPDHRSDHDGADVPVTDFLSCGSAARPIPRLHVHEPADLHCRGNPQRHDLGKID